MNAWKYCRASLLCFLSFIYTNAFAQPTVLGTELVNGSYVTYNLNTVGGFKQIRIQALNNASSGLLKWEFCRGTVGAEDYSVNWRPYTAGQTLSAYNTFIDPATATASARYNTGFGGQGGMLPAVTASNYYTFNITNNGSANNNMSVLETTYNPETITTVTQSPVTVGGTVSPIITVVMSSAPVSNVYVRYSTDNFVTSTLVQLSFVGATGTASIPAQAAGTIVRYYVYNSPRTSAQIGTDVSTYGQAAHDMATLNLNNNGGANYSYTVLPVTVNATNSASDASYSTVAAAFTAINAGTHTGTINVWVSGNTTETISAVLNASGAPSSYTSITVRPSGLRTVTGNLSAPLIDLNGADNVTIDGLNDGSNSLTISNSNTGNAAGTSTIRLYNGATSNTVQNCIIEGSTTSTTSGTIFLSTGTNATISVISNTIRPAGANLPVYSVFASGTSNTGISITGNNIQDYFSATASSAGVFASTGSDAWTVSSNKLYQTASRTVNSLGVIVRAIQVAAGGGYTISNNIIGYANSAGTGTTTYVSTQPNNQVIPIELAGNATVSSIQGNSIANMSITSASNLTSATVPGIFSGIYLSSGAANIGTVASNTIGATTGTGSVTIACSITATQLFIAGIYATSSNSVSISNNNIGSITVTPASAAVQFNFNGIYVPAATGSFSIADNLIGSTTTANSIQVGSTSTAATNFTGINNASTGTVSIAGNTVQNCTVSGTGASALTGIVNTGGTGTTSITNNNIISCANAGTGSFVAISNSAAPTTLNVNGNIIRSNSISSATGSFTGISNTGAVTTTININSNHLGNASGGLITFTVANSTNLAGISNTAGAATAALAIQANDFRGITNSVTGTGAHTYILNSAATLSQNISTNTFTAITSNVSGDVKFISNSVSLGATGTKTVNDNAIVTSFSKSVAGANIYFYYDIATSATGAVINNDGNNFSNITVTGSNVVNGWYNLDGIGTGTIKNITNNTFSNITATTGSPIFPIQVLNGSGNINGNTVINCAASSFSYGISVGGSSSFSIYSNTIHDLSSTGSSVAVHGILVSSGTTHNIYYHTIYNISGSALGTTVTGITINGGTTVRVYKNKIYSLSESAVLVSGGVYGINVTGGTTVSVYNNLVGNLTTAAANFNDAIRGISANGGTTLNVYYNTVYLNSSSSGASFGSSALYASTTPTLDLRNNILYNNSTPGASGLTVAYRRSNTTLTSYAATSNNNIFYAGTPGATRLIFYDGTNSDQTIGAYQTRVSARDNVSATTTLTFVSTTGSSLNFLHLNSTSAAESGGANIAGFTDDYDDEIRQGNGGYTGTGTAPDIGADEFETVACPATPTITGVSSAAPYYAGDVITITGTNLSGITYATINDINATIGTTTATTAQLTIPTTMADSVGIIQVAASSSCTFSNTSNFVFSGYITKGAGTGSGTWSTATIWRNNALPVNNAPATINTGDAVTLNVSADPIKFTINSTATFTHATSNSNIFGATYLNNTAVNGTLVIDNGSILTSSGRFISPTVVVSSAGTFTNNSANAAAVTIANFYVNAGGTYNHNATGSTGAGVVNDFPGSTSRSFGNTSNVVVTKWANGIAPGTGLPASGSPGWGNLTINVATLSGSWNQVGALTNVQGNLNIMATGGGANEFRLVSNTGNITLAIGGSLTISGGIFVGTNGSSTTTINVAGNTLLSAGTYKGTGSSGNFTTNVTGTMTISGGTYTLTNSSSTTGTTNVTGAFTLSSGTITSPGSGHSHVYSAASIAVSGGTFGLSSSSSSSMSITTTGNISISGSGAMVSTSSGPITINCTGDFSSNSSTSPAFAFQNSSSSGKTYTFNLGGNFTVSGSGLFVGGSASSPATINFTGGAASVTYAGTPASMAVTAPVNVKNNFIITSGKTVTLNNSIIPASSSTSNNWTVTVNTGATLNCGATSEIGGANTRTVFTLQTGATLKTAHTGGVFSTTASAASITTTVANASLSDGATYEFNGVAAQVTSAFTTTPTASTVANMVINNSAGVTLSAGYNVTAALQLQVGILTLSTFNLTAASITGSPYSNTKMVNTNSTGALGLPVPTAGFPATVLFPVGYGTEYTPANYVFTANSTARYLNVRAVKPRNVNDLSATNYINNRWWNTTLSVSTGTYTYTANYTYISGDVVGSAAAIRLNRWTGSAWVEDAASSVNTGNLTLNSGTLTETTGPLAATAEWVGRVYVAPAIYHWINPAGGSWLVSTNWTPTGIPASGDGVIFDVAGGATYTTTNMPTGINLTQFTITTNNIVTFNAGAAGTLSMIFPGTATPQFSVAAGSSMTIAGTNAVTFNLPTSATGNVAGTLRLQQAAHAVTVTTAGALVFPSGSYFATGIVPATGFNGNPFGAAGTNGAVIFQNGSVCETFEGSNPFGGAGVNITTFQSGSLFRYSDPNVATSPSVSGRTYSNFTWNANKTTSIAAASSFICDSLTVTLGTFNLNLQGTPTPDHSIKGNINILSGATLSFSPAAAGTVNLNSGTTQIIWGAGTLNVNALETFDINAGTTASLQKNMGVNSTGNVTVNGTLVLTGENYINTPTVAGGTVILNNGGTLSIQSVDGISNTGAGNIRSTNFTYNNGGNFTYSGTANQVTGNRLPLILSGTPLSLLTIANTGTAPNNIVTLTTNNTTTARINLNAGQFNAGTGGTLIIGGGTNLVVGNGGNQYLSGTSSDNIIRFSSNGAVQNTPELWNVTIGTSGTGVDFQNNARINGILLINSGGFVVNNAPRYNTGSYLIYNTGGAYNRNIEWSNNSGLGNPAYPHHVTVQNGTTLDILNPAFDLGCGGDLNLGTTTAGTLVMSSYTQPYDLFVKGNINIGNTAAGTLTMSNSVGCDLFLTGNWTRTANGTVNFGGGNGRSIYFEGTTNAVITANGGQYFPYVRMQKATKATKLTLADHVSVGFEVTFTSGTLDMGTNNKFFTLLSNANYDARVAPSDSSNMDFIYGASDNTGQFIVQRYVPARRAWRLVNAPLKPGGGTHTISQAWQERGNGATGLDYTSAGWVASVAADTAAANYATQISGGTTTNGFDISPNNNSSIKFFSGGGVWSTPANTNNTSVNSQEGWLLFVRGDRETYGEITNQYKTPTVTTLRPRGQIFLGQKTLTASGMTTVGNPYASAVDYFAMTRTGAGWPANPTYYVWDPTLGGSQGVGAFVTLTWNGTDFTRSSPYGAGTYDNRYIASGAAIMVDFPAGGGTLSMNETNKNTDSNTTAFRPVRQLMTVLQTKDTDNNMYVADGALNLFDNSFNNDFDLDDARKLSNVNENICLRRNNGFLSIERKKLNGDADTIFYYMSKLQRKNYQLKFVMDDIEVPQSTAAFLEDAYLNTKTPVSLAGTTIADFGVTSDAASAAAQRFRLVFRRSVHYTTISADILNTDVVINWGVKDELNIDHYEIERSPNGRSFATIASRVSNGDTDMPVNYNGLDVSPAPGEYYYRIKSVSKMGVIAYSDAVKVKVVKSSPELYVFPNPVTNGVIQLQLNKAATGIYSTYLYNGNGQLLNTAFINHAGGTATKTIQQKQGLTSGTYQLNVTAPDGQMTIIKVVIVKE